MDVRPMSDNVFLRDLAKNRVSSGGIAIPDTAESEYGNGVILCEVLKAGPGGWGYNFAFAEQMGEGLDEELRAEQKKNGGLREARLHRFEVDVKPGDKVLVEDTGELLTYGVDLSDWLGDGKAGDDVRIVRSCQILGVVESA